ncbi:MAG: hypothetical protein BA863_16060 [Desulfovibrio sp. S3730MH75]|nr:MAG: hypothetical protein BA863_16060 [Desulfovibrio sp. S3730MH75]
MNLENHNNSLEYWLEDQAKSAPDLFPLSFEKNSDNYYNRRYEDLAFRVGKYLHPYLDRAALASEGIFLTDHGPEHVKRVIKMASGLARSERITLSPYEVYLLLCSIQCHDLGLIYGKGDHGDNASIIMSQLRHDLSDDSTEWRVIFEIARVHSASHGAEKDTIVQLPKTRNLNGHTVQMRRLAALLKLSDELSDWKGRESGYLMNIKEVLKDSEIYHEYSNALHNVQVDHDQHRIVLGFEVRNPEKQSTRGDNQIYLLDEILERTLKVYLEATYCSRFLRPDLDIAQVSVEIEVCNENGFGVLDTINYKLEERGYPTKPAAGILSICEELNQWHNNEPLSGSALASKLSEMVEGDK